MYIFSLHYLAQNLVKENKPIFPKEIGCHKNGAKDLLMYPKYIVYKATSIKFEKVN